MALLYHFVAMSLVWMHPRYRPSVKTIVTVGVVILTVGLCYAMVGMYAYLMHQIESLGI